MQFFKILKPTTISLISTFKCTAKCANCCFGCNPSLNKAMTYEEMKKYVDLCMKQYHDSLKVLVITGGECMIYRKNVEKIIFYATKIGLSTRIVTNAFWATSYKIAMDIVKRLVDCGLKEINFSTGDEHQKSVPLRNVRNASVASARLGLVPIINIETHDNSSEHTLKRLVKDKVFIGFVSKSLIKIEKGVWISFKGNKENLTYESCFMPHRFDRCLNLFQLIPINPYGEVLACCGLTSEQNPYLRLGNINKQPIKEIYETSFKDVLKIWLYIEGPAKILKYIKQRKNEKFSFCASHICDICRTLFMDNENITFLKKDYENYISNLILKYSILNQ